MKNKRSSGIFSLVVCVPAQPPLDSQRVNAPKTGKKTDQQNINFRARDVTLKLGVGPIIMKIPLWKQRQLHKENLDFDVDP